MKIKELITNDDLSSRIKEIANQIEKDYTNENVILICILKGSLFFTTELSKYLPPETIIDFIRVSSYEGEKSSGKINFKLDIDTDITNQNVIIVEDIIDTGRTLSFLVEHLSRKNPKSLKICTLLNKEERREFDIKADYVGFDIPDKFVLGFGLDYDDKYRNLPYIGYVE